MRPSRSLGSVTLVLALALTATAAAPPQPDPAARLRTRTPIKHVVVVVGENVTFDALFATYVPAAGQSMRNLLSEGIVTADGAPGAAYRRAVQHEATAPAGRSTLEPVIGGAYATLPQPTLTGVYDPRTLKPYGAIPDSRFAALASNGPFQITRFAPYGDDAAPETGDPVHRFFQMWQQTGGDNALLSRYVWVAMTAGRGGESHGVTPGHTGQGGELMGFFNMAAGDAPYFRELAQRYAQSDNYHQSIMGGTGANFLALATGDAAVYNEAGRPATPPARQIEDPSPAPGSDNFYLHDGYDGGSWVQCADPAAPGVAAIRAQLARLGRDPNCARGAYYLVNNYAPPFLPDGSPVALGPDRAVYPPQTLPDIGSALSAADVSWGWYSGGREAADFDGDPLFAAAAKLAAAAAADRPAPEREALTQATARELIYNAIGDPLTAFPRVVHGPDHSRLRGLAAFYGELAAGALPAVSFVVPKNIDSGHPGYSAPVRYEHFIRDLLRRFAERPELFASTAILITADEGGGYFDSGYIQTLDFFGDGPRIPLLVVSPYARPGHVDHVYQDHASVLKFIEYNWRLRPLSSRSRDRLPNPRAAPADPYRPLNQPAIGDLLTLFDFGGAPRAR